MQLDSFRDLYASKTDGELLSLNADKNSLADTARLALANKLRRRNLDDLPVSESVSPPSVETSQPDHKRPTPSRLLWIGLFLLDTFLVYQCAWRVPPVVVRMWFAWFARIFGTPSNVAPLDWRLRHLALMTILIGSYHSFGPKPPRADGRGLRLKAHS